MTPSHAVKAGRRYRYYTSRALIDGQPAKAGTVKRVSAPEIDRRVLGALRTSASGPGTRSELVAFVQRVTLYDDRIVVALKAPQDGDRDPGTIELPWARPTFRRAREIIVPPSRGTPSRPWRIETRATLLRAIANGRRWADEILASSVDGPEAIAIREGCSRRQVSATISLASLAPDIVEAAIAGRLPHGVALRDLTDAPLLWSEQRQRIGMREAA